MILFSFLFQLFGFYFLSSSDFDWSLISFLMALNILLFNKTTNYFQDYLYTNQFIDGQHTAIEQYNEDTKS